MNSSVFDRHAPRRVPVDPSQWARHAKRRQPCPGTSGVDRGRDRAQALSRMLRRGPADAQKAASAPAPLEITDRQIDLWLTYYHEVTDPGTLSRMFELLNDAERTQQERFHFADDRLRYLVTRSLVRNVLSRYAAVHPANWVFSVNSYGRPAIADPEGGTKGLNFNLSHTRGLIALAVSRDRALGVDVESIVKNLAPLGVAERFFAPAEVSQLAQVPPACRQDRFLEFWTLKESYVKARGMGLSIPLERFNFDLAGAQGVRLSIDPGLGDDARRWWFRQCRPTPNYLLALCAERVGGDAPALTVRRTIPGHSEELVAMQWLRQSPLETA